MKLEPEFCASEGAVDGKALRTAFGSSPTGVAIITAIAADGRTVGLTVNSFASVSIDPPLLLWSLVSKSPNRAVFEDCTHFAMNLLGEAQESLCRRFASSAIPDKFEGVTWRRGSNGVPLIDGAIAQFECRSDSRVEAGDHIVFFGRVEKFRWREEAPLVFHRGAITRVAQSETA